MLTTRGWIARASPHLRADRIREVFLSHLFHERQRRPRPTLSQWPR